MNNSALDFWREILAHTNKPVIRRKQENNIVFVKSSTEHKSDRTCKTCLAGKMSNTTLGSKRKTSHDPGEVVHTNFCSMEIHSIGGSIYFVTFTDECTGYLRSHAIKRKRDAFEQLLSHTKWIERQTNKRVRTVNWIEEKNTKRLRNF